MAAQFTTKILSKCQRGAAMYLAKRPFVVESPAPIVSFTFDDFPRSALLTGGTILHRAGLAGTYYASFGLMGGQAPTGEIFVEDDLQVLREQRHEIGSHTFEHCHSWQTSTADYVRSLAKNEEALRRLMPGASFRTFSYPISPPWPASKRSAGTRFLCCRGGGQTFNAGPTDLNYLAAFFLEKAADLQSVADLIERNRQARGWLVLATHDVDPQPTPYGVTPTFFSDVVQRVVDSGALVLPVDEAYRRLSGAGATGFSEVRRENLQ